MDSCHVSVDPGGRKVFIANYNSGSIDCFRIVVGGEVSQETQEIPFVGSGPNAERQQAPHAHSVSVGPDGTRLYACDLGSDKVWIFKITDAGLIPNDPAFAQVPPGSGPRHIVFSRDGHFAYVASELGHCVTAFARNAADGGLTPLQTISVIPPELAGEKAATAELALHPSGKWLYVSNRFCNTLSVLQVGADGKVSLIQSVPALVKGPRSFAIDPGGRWLIAAGQEDNRIAELKIDPATGLLRVTTEAAQVGSPACVLFEGN
jgi:6-phosphogluconolactonase